jgi:hypothetical protein
MNQTAHQSAQYANGVFPFHHEQNRIIQAAEITDFYFNENKTDSYRPTLIFALPCPPKGET